MSTPLIGTIISGGQSGVDRGALEAARSLGVDVAGWCPAGGWAEDATVPPGVLAEFPELRPTPASDPAQRTQWNVRDSDATLVLGAPEGVGADSPGTRMTIDHARLLARPLLIVDAQSPLRVVAWLENLGRDLRVNVAGPRRSEWPDGHRRAFDLVRALLTSSAAEQWGQ